MEERLKIKIPPLFEGIIYVFIFAAEILGEVNHFYVRIPGWDTMLHTINAVSYTHLDVYKRQAMYMSNFFFLFKFIQDIVHEG